MNLSITASAENGSQYLLYLYFKGMKTGCFFYEFYKGIPLDSVKLWDENRPLVPPATARQERKAPTREFMREKF